MAFEFEVIIIAIGIIYGYLKPGKEDRMAMLKKGALIGIVLAIVLAGLGGVLSKGKMLLAGGLVGAFAFVGIIILAVLFIIGTFIGDWLEEKVKA